MLAGVILTLLLLPLAGAGFSSAPPGEVAGATDAVRPHSPTLPTPPPILDCGSYAPSILILSPSPAEVLAGGNLTLAGSGFYNTAPTNGWVDIYFAPTSGSPLLLLAEIPAGTPEPFKTTVTIPGTSAGTPIPPGSYFVWADNDTTPPGCAEFPFTLTGTPPAAIGCQLWLASVTVESPAPASGTAGTSVSLRGFGFSDAGSASIYWANLTTSAYQLVGSVDPSVPSGGFNTTVDVPTGYTAGAYAFWVVDSISDCAGAQFALTGASPTLELDVPLGVPGSAVLATGTNFGTDVAVAFTFDGESVASACTTDGSGQFPGTSGTPCAFTVPEVPNGDAGGQNVVATDTDSNRASATYTVAPTITISPSEGPVGTTFTVTGAGFSPYPSGAVVDFDSQLITPTGGSDCAYNANPLITLDSNGAFVCTFTVPAWATSGVNFIQGDDTNSGDLTPVQEWTVPGSAGSGSGSCAVGSGSWGALGSFFFSLPFWVQALVVGLVLATLAGLGYAAGAGSAGATGSGNRAAAEAAIDSAQSGNSTAAAAVGGAQNAGSSAAGALSGVGSAGATATEADLLASAAESGSKTSAAGKIPPPGGSGN